MSDFTSPLCLANCSPVVSVAREPPDVISREELSGSDLTQQACGAACTSSPAQHGTSGHRLQLLHGRLGRLVKGGWRVTVTGRECEKP